MPRAMSRPREPVEMAGIAWRSWSPMRMTAPLAELAFDLSQGRGQGAFLFSSIEVLAKSGRPDGHEQLYK